MQYQWLNKGSVGTRSRARSITARQPVTVLSRLQHTLGNRSVGHCIQAKLKISEPHDAYEQEADRVADQVMRMPDQTTSHEAEVSSRQTVPQIQRMCTDCEEEEAMRKTADEEAEEEPVVMRAKAATSGRGTNTRTNQGSGCESQTTADLASVGGGQPLPSQVRNFFEPRFGYDFGQVRIHTDGLAVDNARSLNALAYTSGRDIVFDEGQYAPTTFAGRRLLGHELTHVVQQDRRFTPDTVQRQPSPDSDYFDPHTKEPKRGFRSEDLAQLTKSGDQLSFAGDLSPLTKDAQKMLLENIAATVRFALDPNDPTRLAELQVQRDFFAKNPEKFFDKPAERIDYSDLYHGHICVPRPTLNNKAGLRKLGAAVLAQGSAVDEGIIRVLGMGMPTKRGQSEKVMAVVDQHRQLFLDALGPLLQALASVPDAGVEYHTWEHEWRRPLLGGKRMDRSHPARNIFTPFSSHRPKFLFTAEPHCESLADFSFHVDKSGRIMLLPAASSEMVRAFEILHDALVPTAEPKEEPAAETQAPPEKRWTISAAAGGDVTPDAERLAFALGGRISIKADEALVFNPAIGFNLIYLPSSSFNASHLLAATADVTARLQQPLSGFYFDISAGGFAGFDIDPKRETSTKLTGGPSFGAGLGWRFENLDVGAETRALVPEANFDRTNVLVFGRVAWRFEEVKETK